MSTNCQEDGAGVWAQRPGVPLTKFSPIHANSFNDSLLAVTFWCRLPERVQEDVRKLRDSCETCKFYAGVKKNPSKNIKFLTLSDPLAVRGYLNWKI